MQIDKVHGSENHFFLLDQTQLQTKLSDQELINFTTKITDSKTGLLQGADGVLVVDEPTHQDALAQMRVINADGSEASMCGNGLRTVSRYLAKKFQVDQFKVQTLNADLKVSKAADFAPNVPAFSVEISPVSFTAESLPFHNPEHQQLVNETWPELLPELKFTAVAVPNPHLISFVSADELASSDLGTLGKRLNQPNSYFPDGVNVSFAQILGQNKLFVRTFERGVGFTNACGTGMSATSLAFALTHPDKGQFDQEITVYNPGGMVKTNVHKNDTNYDIDLIGNATVTHHLELSEADLHAAKLNDVKITQTDEETSYLQFVDQLPKINDISVKM
ncbi:diaminopimelate epimerase [Pediococcus ethanolidurans]|uniref:diaminopimelate epimerase n=1 Tax=Pediococcus ethanolidurans TaxID=319653 RepID=UPI0021AAE811|nr:diaminopimelate epimerase [Pediococcus ethanolidurans]MCT4398263.1 diaminopimelate epimerase [Pediococcus ethanolidurans]